MVESRPKDCDTIYVLESPIEKIRPRDSWPTLLYIITTASKRVIQGIVCKLSYKFIALLVALNIKWYVAYFVLAWGFFCCCGAWKYSVVGVDTTTRVHRSGCGECIDTVLFMVVVYSSGSALKYSVVRLMLGWRHYTLMSSLCTLLNVTKAFKIHILKFRTWMMFINGSWWWWCEGNVEVEVCWGHLHTCLLFFITTPLEVQYTHPSSLRSWVWWCWWWWWEGHRHKCWWWPCCVYFQCITCLPVCQCDEEVKEGDCWIITETIISHKQMSWTTIMMLICTEGEYWAEDEVDLTWDWFAVVWSDQSVQGFWIFGCIFISVIDRLSIIF